MSWKVHIWSIIAVFILMACVYDVELRQIAKDVRAKELDAGRCSNLINKSKKDRKSPTGHSMSTDYFRIQESTDTIKANLGAQFGMEYLVFADTRGWIPLKIVWTFPEPIINEKGKSFTQHVYKTSKRSHQRHFLAYRMGKKYMVKKGEWKVEIYYKRLRILEKTFFMI